jgi:hypothetical protein
MLSKCQLLTLFKPRKYKYFMIMPSIVKKFSFDREIFSAVFLSYCVCFFLVAFIVTPVQTALNLPQTDYASLVFLPHGIRVLSIWLFKERAIIPLFLAHLFAYMHFFWIGESAFANLGLVLVGTFCAPIAFVLVGATGIDISTKNAKLVHWRAILLIGFLASIINSIGNSFLLSPTIHPSMHLSTAATYLIGDTIGVLAVLFILLFSFRFLRLVKK